MRSLLSHAFSANALREQMDIVVGLVDLLISRLEEQVGAAKGFGEADIMRWYKYVIADLTFGEPLYYLRDDKSVLFSV